MSFFHYCEVLYSGRPSVVFYDPNLPNPGKTVLNSSVSLTFIGVSNALGEALPTHLQFYTSAKPPSVRRSGLILLATN